MLNERLYEAERFATEEVSTVTVEPDLLISAANDGANRPAIKGLSQSRRLRRKPLSASSTVGGWKVRMW
jgi:hypothetical protein